MAPSFLNFKQLRRKSRASFRTGQSTDSSSEGSHNSHGTTPTIGSLTPPSLAHQSDPALHLQTSSSGSSPPPVPPVPPIPPVPTRAELSKSASSSSSLNASATAAKRTSVCGMAGLGSPMSNSSYRTLQLPVSPFSPRLTNISDNAWAYQKVLVVHGTIGDLSQPNRPTLDGTLTVGRLDDAFPPIQWPVCGSHFKALVYLLPGANKLRFDFASPKLANSGSSNPIHASYFTIHMVPPMNAPPMQLAILLASDSPGTFDAVPPRVESEGNGLETAIRKFRMAAYLWQAYTAEQMWRNRLGRRVFRFEEEWTHGTCNMRDRESGQMRSEARIHVIRTDKTIAELRSLDNAQQNPKAKNSAALFSFATDAVRNYFQPKPGQVQYVSVLLLDAHWDRTANLITGHAALGGGGGDLRLGIFGSHCLQSYPSSFEEVVPAFTDCTPTDTNYVANDCNEAGSSWEAATLGIGAHMHETGHMLGLPHRESGVMLRDYVTLNRSFLTREAFSTRTKSQGGLVLEKDECTWHRLDCLSFRTHPCFRLPNDPAPAADDSVQAWPIEGGSVAFMASSGVAYMEICAQGDDVCRAWIEYPPENGTPLQRQVVLSEQDIRNRLPEEKRKKDPIRISIRSWAGGNLDIPDVRELVSSRAAKKVTGRGLLMGKTAYRSAQLGLGQMEGSQEQEVIFTSAQRRDRVLSRIAVYHGQSLDGIEFVYDDGSSQLFGKRGGKPGGDVFEMDIRRGEYIICFYLRSGFWIDGIQILTSLGRRSPIYGNAHGGSGHTLIPPRGYNICGVSGSCAAWVDSFAVLIMK